MEQNVDALLEKRTVLVVEDNEMNREILCDLLLDEFEVLEAENGLDALRQMEAHGEEISVILLDVYMPECNGFEFLEKKQQDRRYDSVPVIMMTASDSVDDEIRCLSMGATDFVTKPYNIEVVKNRMKSVIRLRESAAMLNRLEVDKLTGLYSKEFFYHNVDRVLEANPTGHYDLICSDVENFRTMNERYGRANCDEFLKSLLADLRHAIPDIVLGGRIGADVFAFLIRTPESDDWAYSLPHEAQENAVVNYIMNYGILRDLPHDLPSEEACDRATLALRQIKRNINIFVTWYDDQLRKNQMREHQIIELAPAAIRNREFQIYYQPKHSLATDTTGGAEALVRWIHPELGFISPGMFIPLFERNGFITQLDFYIWEEVCKELKRLRELGLPAIPVSVNVSRMDFNVPNLASQIGKLADRYGIPHSLLHIEVTESIYGDDPARISQALEDLHANGFIIELDDFGSGYSSLTSLNSLRLDVMKLDMSIIRQATATKDYGILRFATLLADGLRLKTVAEGVEHEEEVAALKVLGCDYIQGYFYSKPLPADQFEEYLSRTA